MAQLSKSDVALVRAILAGRLLRDLAAERGLPRRQVRARLERVLRWAHGRDPTHDQATERRIQ